MKIIYRYGPVVGTYLHGTTISKVVLRVYLIHSIHVHFDANRYTYTHRYKYTRRDFVGEIVKIDNHGGGVRVAK